MFYFFFLRRWWKRLGSRKMRAWYAAHRTCLCHTRGRMKMLTLNLKKETPFSLGTKLGILIKKTINFICVELRKKINWSFSISSFKWLSFFERQAFDWKVPRRYNWLITNWFATYSECPLIWTYENSSKSINLLFWDMISKVEYSIKVNEWLICTIQKGHVSRVC